MRNLYNVEAESDVLSILSRNPETMFRHDIALRENSFSDPVHREIFRFILSQYKEGTTIIVPSIFSSEIDKQGTLQSIINRGTPGESYLSLVKSLNDVKFLRELKDVGNNIVYEVEEGKTSGQALVEQYGSKLSDIQLTSDTDAMPNLVADLAEYSKFLDDVRENASHGKPVVNHGPITNTSIDDFIVGGLEYNDLCIVAAATSMGKTQWALQTAVVNLEMGMPVVIFSLEMSKQQMFNRILSHLTQINSVNLKTGEGLDANDWTHIKTTIERMSKWKLFIDDSQTVNLSDILAKAKKLKFLEKKLGLIIVDYAQLVNNDLVTGNRNEKVGGVARMLKILAGQIHTPVMLLSQIKRGIDDREDESQPRLSDLRDSGELESNADQVMFLFAPREERRNAEPETTVTLAKYRNGPIGEITTRNIKNVQTFREIRSASLE